PGLLRAVNEAWPKSLRIRCWVHKMRNILDKLPESARVEVKPHQDSDGKLRKWNRGCGGHR
ncbi:MAG: hypothetical protein AB1492_05785, partial [Bacillota bacterium]